MKKNKFIFLFLISGIYFVIALISQASIINQKDNSYDVNSVRVDGASFENEISTKQMALTQAKQSAFNDLMQYLKVNDMPIEEVNINSAISSYSILDEYYNENFYSLVANFTFDKDIVKSLIRKNYQNQKGNGEVGDYVVVLKERNDVIEEYVKFVSFLKTEKIKFYPVEIKAGETSILLLKVLDDKIYTSLKELGLNGKIYRN